MEMCAFWKAVLLVLNSDASQYYKILDYYKK